MKKAYFSRRDVINSIKFYLMLQINLSQIPNFYGDLDFQLQQYYKMLREDEKQPLSEDTLELYTKLAWEGIPSSFLKTYGIEGLQRF